MQCQRAESPGRHLLLELPAWAHKDRGGPRLVDGDPRACDLRARGAPQGDELAGALNDGDDDPVAVLAGVTLGRVEDRFGAGFVDRSVGGDVGHGQAPFAASSATQTAESVVMNNRLRSGPPKQKFTAPDTRISPISRPAGSCTWTPENEEA